jgi:hypothetical protein
MIDDVTRERIRLSEADADAHTRRREALHRAVADLERELDALADEPVPSTDRFRAAIRDMLVAIRQHIDEAEAPDGLLGQIVHAAPWFAARVEQLRGEHDDLLARGNALLVSAAADGEVATLLAEARELVGRVSDHRHAGTALLVDTYLLDIPQGD